MAETTAQQLPRLNIDIKYEEEIGIIRNYSLRLPCRQNPGLFKKV